MENTGSTPDARQARAALADVEDATRSVRNTPWPTWIYGVNALLLGAAALTPLLQTDRRGWFLAVVFATIGVNVVAGYQMGAPWTLPTSRGFLAAAFTSFALVAAAFALAEFTAVGWPVVVAVAAAATAAYLVAGVVHRRSTGPVRGPGVAAGDRR